MARSGSLSEAAGLLETSASTVSRRVERLERNLQETLFLRRHDGYRLTQVGASTMESAEKIEAQLKAEVQELLTLAEKADQADVPEGVDLPAEIRRREDRLAAMAEALSLADGRGYAGQWARAEGPWGETAPITGWLAPAYPYLLAGLMKLGGGVTVLFLGGGLLALWLRELRRNRESSASNDNERDNTKGQRTAA